MTPDEPDDDGPFLDFRTAQRRLFESVGLDVESRFLDLGAPPVRTHVFECGGADGGPDDQSVDGAPPLVFVHGTDAFGAFLAPLLAAFDGARVVGFDRPGYGLSDPFAYTEANVRRAVVEAIGSIVDDLGVERVDLVGHSMGGHAAIRFALERPERVRRLVTLGAIPGFPGTAPPMKVRLLTVPVLGRLIQRVQTPSREAVLEVAEIFGEREAIQAYPALIDAVVAQVADPDSAEAGFSEFNALASIRGWRASARLGPDELGGLDAPALMIWGERDPLGGPDAAREGVAAIPDVRFEAVDAGHMPFLAHASECARIIEAWRAGSAGGD